MTSPRKYKVRTESPHDFSLEPVCQGRIVKFDKLEIDDEERLYMVVDTFHTLAQVFHSFGLTEAFDDGVPGDMVRIVFHGKKKLKGAKSFNKFSVQVWEFQEGVDDVQQEEA